MDPDQRKLARHLFAEATALCEDAHALAVRGQSPTLTEAKCRRDAGQLRAMAGRIGALADALLALSRKPRQSR